MATGFIGHLSQVFCTRSPGAIDCKKTAGEQTTGFCALRSREDGLCCHVFSLWIIKVFSSWILWKDWVYVVHSSAAPQCKKNHEDFWEKINNPLNFQVWCNRSISSLCFCSGRGMRIKELRAALLEVCSWIIIIKIVVNIIIKLFLCRSQILFTWIRLQNLMCDYKITGEFTGF